MTKFIDLMKKIPDGIFSSDNVKSALQKTALEEKIAPSASLIEICKTLQDDNKSLFQFLVASQNTLFLENLIALLDKNKIVELETLLIEALYEAIKLSQKEMYQILMKTISQDALQAMQNVIRQLTLRHSHYHFIMFIFQETLDYNSSEQLLALAQNKQDIAFLIQQFAKDVIINTRDNENNNIIHLALHNNNSNIFRYVINHYGIELLYQPNHANLTPIALVYHDIETRPHTITPDFSRLMLLDQVGADLEMKEYQEIYQRYQDMPDYHHQFLLAKQVKQENEIYAVSFNGGGVKGHAFMSAYREALKHGILQEDIVKQFGGTSAGAITASLFALGLTISRATEELEKFDFTQLMSDPTTNAIRDAKANYEKKWVEYYQQGYYGYLLYDILTTVASESFANIITGRQPLITAIQELLSTTTGLFKPTYLRNTLHRLIGEQIKGKVLGKFDPAHITLKDLQDHPEIFNACELVVYITNLTESKTEKCSAQTSPNMAVVDAVVYSASFPLFFEAAQKHIIITNAQGQRERVPVLLNGKPVYVCDGGVLKNDPVDAFDQGEFNEHALTFMLVGSEAKNIYEYEKYENIEKKSENCTHVLSQLISLMRSSEKQHLHNDPRNSSRIIYIDTKNVGTLDFQHKAKNAPILEIAAQEGVISFLNRRTANGYSVLRHETISLLMSYGVAKLSTSGLGQMIQINPGKRLSPQQILRVYAAATDNEMILLRSIINPNHRDLNGANAMVIANALGGFDNTLKRLKLAGAAMLEEKTSVATPAVPAYFLRGESFLKSHVHDDYLQELHTLYSDIKILKAEKDSQQVDITSVETRLKLATEKVLFLQNAFSTSQDQLDIANELNTSLRNENTELLKTLAELRESIKSLQSSNAMITDNLGSTVISLNAAKDTIGTLETEIKSLQVNTTDLSKKLISTETSLNAAQLNCCQTNTQLKALQAQSKEVTHAHLALLATRDSTILSLKQDKLNLSDRLITSLIQLRTTHAELKSTQEALERANAQLQLQAANASASIPASMLKSILDEYHNSRGLFRKYSPFAWGQTQTIYDMKSLLETNPDNVPIADIEHILRKRDERKPRTRRSGLEAACSFFYHDTEGKLNDDADLSATDQAIDRLAQAFHQRGAVL